MICLTYTITCDGTLEDDVCEAEFSHTVCDRYSDSAGVDRQLRQRGWTCEKNQLYCPLCRASKAER